MVQLSVQRNQLGAEQAGLGQEATRSTHHGGGKQARGEPGQPALEGQHSPFWPPPLPPCCSGPLLLLIRMDKYPAGGPPGCGVSATLCGSGAQGSLGRAFLRFRLHPSHFLLCYSSTRLIETKVFVGKASIPLLCIWRYLVSECKIMFPGECVEY